MNWYKVAILSNDVQDLSSNIAEYIINYVQNQGQGIINPIDITGSLLSPREFSLAMNEAYVLSLYALGKNREPEIKMAIMYLYSLYNRQSILISPNQKMISEQDVKTEQETES